MKNKYLINFNYVMSHQFFKVILIFSVLTAIYAFTLGFEYPYLDSSIHILTFGWVNIIFLFNLFLTTTITYYTFDKNTNYIIRLKNKKQYLKEMIKQILFNNFIVLTLQLILIFLALLPSFANGSGTGFYYIYHISKFSYLLFYLVRMYLVYFGICILNVLLLKVLWKEVVIGVNGILGVFLILGGTSATPKISILEMPFLMTDYLTFINYHSFRLELLCSIIYIVVFIIFLVLLFCFVHHTFKKVGD